MGVPRLTTRTGAIALAALVALSTALRFAASQWIVGPFIAPDEMIYALLGRSLWSTGHLSILGADTPFYSLLYPALVGLPLSIGTLATGFELLQGLQAFVVSLTAVAVYDWGRRFLSPGWALVAAALALTPPALVYSGLVMSEALFLPVVTVAAWALARAVEEPSRARQGLLALAILAALLTRLQAVVLFPVAISAVLVDAGLARDWRRLVPWRPAAVVAIVLATGWVLVSVLTGTWRSALGAYGTTIGSYDVGRAASFVTWHAADVFLLCVGVPLVALGVLVVEAAAGRLAGGAERALVAVALSLTVWLTLQVGIFASKYVSHLAERDLVGVLPPLFLVLALWLSRGAPRPQPWTTVLALAVAAPAILLPIARYATLESEPDSFMLIPFVRAAAWGEPTLQTVWLVGVAVAVVAVVLIPRRLAPLLAVAVGVVLLAASVRAHATVGDLTVDTRHRFFGDARPGWVDRTANGPVAVYFDGGAYWPWVWHHVLWNRDIRAIVHPPAQAVPGVMPQRAVGPRFDGLLLGLNGQPLRADYVVAPTVLAFAGDKVAEIRQQEIDRAGLALWRVPSPVKVASEIRGTLPNGDFSAMQVTVYACAPGRLELTLLPKSDEPVVLRANGRVVETTDLGDGEFWNGSIPTPPEADGNTSCDFSVESAGLVGSTRVEFVPDG